MFSCFKSLKNNIIIISLAFLFCFWFTTRCFSCCWHYGYVVTENVDKKEVISKQQLCMCTRLIGTFLCHHCATTRWKCLIDAFIFYGLEQKKTTTNFSLSLSGKLVTFLKNWTSGEVIWKVSELELITALFNFLEIKLPILLSSHAAQT